jgi:hypothetical protein
MGIIGSIYTMLFGPTWRYSLGYLAIIPGILLSLAWEKKNSASQRGLSYLREIIPARITPAATLFLLAIAIPLLSAMVNNLKAFNYLRIEIQEAITDGRISMAIYDRPRVLLPPKILNFSLGAKYSSDGVSFTVTDLELMLQETADVVYHKPTTGLQCWDSELPCAELLTYEKIRLRDPKSGIGKGFVRANQSN